MKKNKYKKSAIATINLQVSALKSLKKSSEREHLGETL